MKYVIDYEYGKAVLYTPSEDWKNRFYDLAEQCFGIRKSIGKVALISASQEESQNSLKNECERLEHHGDLIVWDKDGNKIKSEWDD